MDDWDSIDWDEKVEDIIKQKQQELTQPEPPASSLKFLAEDDGNYFDEIQKKKKLREETTKKNRYRATSRSNQGSDIYFQPYSHKDLVRIRNFTSSSSTFHNLIFETFGQLERFLETHQTDLTHESIVELLIIDVALLEVPFHNHNQKLLLEISKLPSFWKQLVDFLQVFFESKHQDLKFLLSVDMHRFFENIELLMHNLLVSNLFSSEMEEVMTEIVNLMENRANNEWSNLGNLKKMQEEYQQNKNVFKIFEIYPCLDDFASSSTELSENLVKGQYDSVSQYLQIHLPLLKEDFIGKLRNGINQLRSMNSLHKIVKTPDVWIFPKVQLNNVMKTIHNMNCKSVIVQLPANQKSSINFSRRFFNGQLLCFSSSKDFIDLILATVINREDEISLEIIATENISEILDRDLIMVEPTTFFEPYHRVFNVLKNHNELNFPFKDKILKLEKTSKFPSYQHPEAYSYKNSTCKVKNFDKWPSHQDLGLELMQLRAVQAAVTQDFTIIQGPPGTGKTFIGLEILEILLENTNETILILTQTNNALDKFLVGASKFTDSIARLGGQCKCVEIERFLIKSVTPFESKKYLRKIQAEVTKSSSDEEISKLHRLIEEIHQLSTFYAVKDKRIVGMTTTYAARTNFINKMLKPGIVIVEEASEVLESHVLVSLTKHTKQLIMIGDHQQLKPLTNNYELAKNFNFNVSLFERLVRNDLNFVTLDVQMRMSSDICDLVRGTVYKMLKDGENVKNYPDVAGMPGNFYCVSHSNPESVGDGETSKENPFEADFVVKLCDYLVSAGNDARQVTILTAYAAQSQLIRQLLKEISLSHIRVAVLDAYQGEESDIILLSLVRSNNRKDIGFLANENRIAVVLSRAKFGFYIVSNMDCLANASAIWRKIRDILREKNVIGDRIPDLDLGFY